MYHHMHLHLEVLPTTATTAAAADPAPSCLPCLQGHGYAYALGGLGEDDDWLMSPEVAEEFSHFAEILLTPPVGAPQ